MLVQKNKILSNFGGPFENLSVNAVPILKYTKIIGNIISNWMCKILRSKQTPSTKISNYNILFHYISIFI